MAKPTAILACDVGNSRIALGCVIGQEVSAACRVDARDANALADTLAAIWAETPAPRRVVASSVNPPGLTALEAAAGKRLGEEVHLIGRDLPAPLPTDVALPEEVGTDRLCSAAMAYHRLGSACVVADLGTAITVDCVSDDGVFLGGAILPGLRMSAAALARGTAALPEVTPVRPEGVFGTDTRSAILAGIVYGVRGAVRELIEAYATEMGKWLPLILTGGDAELVGLADDLVHAIVPDLCLMGIALAWHVGQSEQK